MVQTIPKYLASMVEQLELDHLELLTIKDIQKYAVSVGATVQAARITFELKNRGWLLPTSARGVYEFSPASNAGAYSKGGKLLDVKAVSLANPEIKWFYSHQSALYFHKIVAEIES